MSAADIFAPFTLAVSVCGALFGVAVNGLNQIHGRDTEAYFEPVAMRAERDGQTARLWVDRIIHRPIHMRYTVRVMASDPQGWHEVCMAQGGPILYEPGNVLRQPVSLEWWTGGQCATLPSGRARIVTTWAPTPPGLQPVTLAVEVGG